MLEFLLPPNRPPLSDFSLLPSAGDTTETLSVVRFLLRKGVYVDAVSAGSAARCPWELRSLEFMARM